ncbi:MAG: YqeG family HAD IIIA-type phosphatase [Velocimicrobium sp.]
MFQSFFPDECVKSVYVVDFRTLYKKGYRGIIFDVDNTLVAHGMDATEASMDLFKCLNKIGFKTCLMSNNKEERIKRFNKKIQTHYIFKANKPSRKNYYEACRKMGTVVENTVFIGDQLFTDVWGAKRCGIHNILVEPINKKEEVQIVLKRYLEKLVLFFYRKKLEHLKKANDLKKSS